MFAAQMRFAASAVFAALLAAAMSPSVATPQQRPQRPFAVVFGHIIDAENRQPVLSAEVGVEGTRLLAITDSLGRYRLERVPPGPQVLRVEALGYAVTRVPVTVPVRDVLIRDIEVAPSALELEGITVTADPTGRARGELATASVIDREAIAHQTAPSLAKLLELVPGVPIQPPGLEEVQQISLRAVPTSSGGVVGGSAAAADLSSYGTLIILDGVPLSNNANLQTTGPRGEILPPTSAGGGIDLRRMPATMIERVEVIRGLPSARYGDLTQGAIVVDTRAGVVDPVLLASYDARTVEGSVVGGRTLFRNHTATVNFDLAYTRKYPGLYDDDVYRLSTQIAHRAELGDADRLAVGEPRLVLDSRFDFYQVYEDNPEEPEVAPGRASWTRDQGLRLLERARLALTREAWLEFTASLSHTRQRSYVQSLMSRGATPFTDRLDPGRAIGHYIGGAYVSPVHLDGDPWLIYTRAEAGTSARWFGFEHRLRAGLEARREWNDGPGYRFNIEYPPQVTFNGVEGFYRPRRFDDVPPLATSAFYLDDRLTRWLAGDMLLNVQAGLRLDLLHRGTHWFTWARDWVVQPRLNAEFAPWPWLRLRGAWGRTTKQPALSALYPAPQYFDVINVNWYTPDPAERLAVLTTFVRNPRNPDLGMAVARKAELGVELGLGARSAISIVGFSDRISDGIGIRPDPIFLLRDHYELTDSVGGTGQPPEIIEPPAYSDTVPVIIDRPANNLTLKSEGVEVTASFPEIRALRTRFELQGAWVRSRLERQGVDFGAAGRFTDFQLDGRKPRAPYWDSPVLHGERALMAYRLVHHQPELGLVVTATIQHAIREERRDIGGTDTLAFAGYITRDARLVPVPEAERTNPEYEDLRVARTGLLTEDQPAPADWFLSFQVSKTLPLGGRLSFYAFNALDRVGIYGGPTVGHRLFAATRFGFELTMPGRSLVEPLLRWLE